MTAPLPEPDRGEVWYADLEPRRGHDQGMKRPVVIVSDDGFNHGPSELVIVVPVTSTLRPLPRSRIRIKPPEGGLTEESDILADQIRTISRERLSARRGKVSRATLGEIEDRLRMLLALG